MSLQVLKNRLSESRGQRDLLTKQVKEKQEVLASLTLLQSAQEAVQLIIQRTARETQDQLKIHIQDLVQSAIDVCFPGQYEFVMEFETKRGRTECSLFVQQGNEIMDPLTSSGGGLVDILSLALRIAALSLSQYDKVLLLDEPLKFLSSDLKPIAAEMFKELAHKLGIQLIMVTHDKDFVNIADKKFLVWKIKERSIVEEVCEYKISLF